MGFSDSLKALLTRMAFGCGTAEIHLQYFEVALTKLVGAPEVVDA